MCFWATSFGVSQRDAEYVHDLRCQQRADRKGQHLRTRPQIERDPQVKYAALAMGVFQIQTETVLTYSALPHLDSRVHLVSYQEEPAFEWRGPPAHAGFRGLIDIKVTGDRCTAAAHLFSLRVAHMQRLMQRGCLYGVYLTAAAKSAGLLQQQIALQVPAEKQQGI